MGTRSLITVVLCCLFSGLELLGHWFMAASHSTVGQSLFLVYTSRAAPSGKGFFPVTDLIIPALGLGVLTGRLWRGAAFSRMLICILLLSTNVVSLTLLYPKFFVRGALWWARAGCPSTSSVLLWFFESSVLAAFGFFLGVVGLRIRRQEARS